MMYHVCAGKGNLSGYPICMLTVNASDAKDAVNKWWSVISCAAYAYDHGTVLVEVAKC